MAIIRVHQPHTLSKHRQAVEDAASIVGEQVLVLEMYSALNPANSRCSICYDEVYGNSSTSLQPGEICSACFGTTYENGISQIHFTKAVVGRGKFNDSMEGSKGQASMVSHKCSTLWPAKLHRNDCVVRVFKWDTQDDLVVASDIEVYKIVSSPVQTVLKDGFQPTGTELSRMGSMFDIVLQSERHPLYDIEWPKLPRKLVASRTPFVYIPQWEFGASVSS